MATPSYARSRAVTRFPEVLDVHLAAQLLIVSADTIYALFQRGDLPGRKVGRKWLTTKTAVLKWLEHSAGPRATAALAAALARAIAQGDTAALVDAVQTGTARLGTKVQSPTREHAVGAALRLVGAPLGSPWALVPVGGTARTAPSRSLRRIRARDAHPLALAMMPRREGWPPLLCVMRSGRVLSYYGGL
jgi:excisionase family DNA binding protein